MDDDEMLLAALIIGCQAALSSISVCSTSFQPTQATALLSMARNNGGDHDMASGFLLREAVLEYLALTRRQLGYGSYLPADDLYTRFSQIPSLFKAITNFFPPAFDELFIRVQPLISVPVDIRGNRRAALQQQPRAVGPSGRPVGRPPKLSLRTRYLVFLSVLRGGSPLVDQIMESGQNQQGLSDDFYHMVPATLEALDDEIRWPTQPERVALRGKIWDFPASGVACPIGLVDGSIQPIQTPHDGSEPLFYCSRKSVHGWNHQLVCRWDGKLLGVFPGFYGSVHDSLCYRMTDLHINMGQYFSGTESLIGDCGYQGCGILHVRKGATTREELQYNSRLRRHRVLIEFVIGAIKKKFSIVGKVWTRGGGNLRLANDTFVVCCQLFNF